MAKIYPFQAIRPNPALNLSIEETAPQAESVMISYDHNAVVLKNVLETPARLRPETPVGQQQAYLQIANELNLLFKKGLLLPCLKPCIYVYEAIAADGRPQTGVWCLTEKTGIKLHEHTLADSVRRLRNYRQATGLEGSPVLLTYEPDEQINRLIDQAKSNQTMAIGRHRIWKIEENQQAFIDAFAGIKAVYLADGHHRLESTDDQITALYMATDQLQLSAFHRIVQSSINPQTLLHKLKSNFYIEPARGPVFTKQQHRFGLRVGGLWFHLTVNLNNRADVLDAVFLQEAVLQPIFDINDPATDTRLKCAGSLPDTDDIVFTMAPLTIADILNVADAGEILPPKSSWIDPKVPYGLLIYQS